MPVLTSRWPHRARLASGSVPVHDRKGTAHFHYAVGDPSQYVFTIDIYGYRDHAHPHRHVGWWRLDLPAGQSQA
jgi:hypothetical protein